MSRVKKPAVLDSSVDMIRDYYEKEHKHNKDRIKYGMIAMLIIPIIFLVLLFVVPGSKVIFLVMWIASLFIISGYLIAIEYKDYNMSENLGNIIGDNNNDTLIDTTRVISDLAKSYIISNDNNEADNDKHNDNTNNTSDEASSDNIDINDICIPINTEYIDDKADTVTNADKPENNESINNCINNNQGNKISKHSDIINKSDINNCQNIVIDNKVNANTISISIDNNTNAINITISPNKEAAQ